MTRVRTAVLLALVVPVAVLVACGDDGDGDGDGGGLGATEGGGSPAGGGDGAVGFDACGLLEVAEIEAQWPDLGPIGDGEATGTFCTWTLGDQPTSPVLTLGVLGHEPGQDAAGSLAVLRETMSDPVPVAAGDEAYASGDWLYVRAGENLANVATAGFDPDAGSQVEALTTLADAAADRLPDDYLGSRPPAQPPQDEVL